MPSLYVTHSLTVGVLRKALTTVADDVVVRLEKLENDGSITPLRSQITVTHGSHLNHATIQVSGYMTPAGERST